MKNENKFELMFYLILTTCAAFILCFIVSTAKAKQKDEHRPYDPHIAVLYRNNVPVKVVTDLWDKKDCEVIASGMKYDYIEKAFRPYQNTPYQTLEYLAYHVECERK